MKAAKTVFLISALSLLDPANSKGQLLNGQQVGNEEERSAEKFEERGSNKDNLADIDKQISDYNLLQKKIDADNTHLNVPPPTTTGFNKANDIAQRHEKKAEEKKKNEKFQAELDKYAIDEKHR